MTVYWVQHGEAVPAEQDAGRPLNETGLAEVEAVTLFLNRCWKPALHTLYHNDKLRAQQTASIVYRRPDSDRGMGPAG